MAPPLTPTPDDGRRLLARELAKPQYQHANSLFEQWLDRLLQSLAHNAPGYQGGYLLATLAVLLIVGLVIWLLVRNRLDTSPDGSSGEVSPLVDPLVSPAQYRAMAEEHLAAGRTDQALVAAFRSIVSDLDRRTVLGDRPARTAHEVAASIAQVFPSHVDAITQSAQWFDVAAYGISHGDEPRSTPDQVRSVLDLGSQLAVTRPVWTDRTTAGVAS